MIKNVICLVVTVLLVANVFHKYKESKKTGNILLRQSSYCCWIYSRSLKYKDYAVKLPEGRKEDKHGKK